jgi:hypothetical protein
VTYFGISLYHFQVRYILLHWFCFHWLLRCLCETWCDIHENKAGDTLSSCHVSSCDVHACSWDVRGDLTLNSMAQIHTSLTLLTSRDLACSSGRLTCQHASQISAVARVSWDVTYVSSALQALPIVSKNRGNAFWKKVRQRTFLYDTKSPDHRDQHMRANVWEGIGKELKIKRRFYVFTCMCDLRIVCPRP